MTDPALRAVPSGRILVVDDEPLILRAVKRIMGGEHELHLAGSAAEGLALLRGGLRPDVILCDLMMPDMSGMDFFDAVTAELPDLAGRFVFLSGGAYTERARAFLEGNSRTRLDKPFTAAELRELVARRLTSG